MNLLRPRRDLVLMLAGLFLSVIVPSVAAAQHPSASWREPKVFPILPWGTLQVHDGPEATGMHGLPSVAECNFTIAGFVQPKDLAACERLGLLAIMAPPTGAQGWFRRGQAMTQEQADEVIAAMVKRTGDSKAVLGYYIMDEPGAPDFPLLAKAVAAVRKLAPGKLAYINLFPGYATIGAPNKSQLGTASFAEYLERYVKEVKPQFLSYDNYMVQYSVDLKDTAKASRYYLDLMEVRRVALENKLAFWNIVSSNQIRPPATPPSVPNLFFQAYTTLAAGGHGVSWYTYYARNYRYAPIDMQGRRTTTWRYLQLVNHHLKTIGPLMNDLKSTGVFFSAPAPVKSLPLLPGRVVRGVESTDSVRHPAARELPVMVGEFVDADGHDYVMVVNLSLERSANLRLLTAQPKVKKEVISAEDGRRIPWDEKNGHWLTAGQGLLVRLGGGN